MENFLRIYIIKKLLHLKNLIRNVFHLAAIKAVQARALIAQKRLLYQQSALGNPRFLPPMQKQSPISKESIIPEAPDQKPARRSQLATVSSFMSPVPNEVSIY